MNQPPLNPYAIRELTEAIRLTVEYVGTGILPAIPGWSWYDAMVKYAPNDAEVLRAMDPLPEPAAALPEVTSVEELDQLPVGSVVRGGEDDLVGEKIRFSPYLPHWCTIGEEVEADKLDLLPAHVLYRPEVKP